MRATLLIALGASTILGAAASSSSHAFDNTQFCQAVGQFTRAATRDVGTWINRTTRNDGVEVFCDRKLVHFKRYVSTPGSGTRDAWRESKTEEWRNITCTNALWREAVDNGWIISATVTIVTGEKVWFACQPGGTAFHRAIP
jgi:hypothetical protein